MVPNDFLSFSSIFKISFLIQVKTRLIIKNIKPRIMGYVFVSKINIEKEHAVPIQKWSKFLNVTLFKYVYFDAIFVNRIMRNKIIKVNKKLL